MVEDKRLPLVPGQVRVVVESTQHGGDSLTTRVRVIDGQIPEDLDSPASLFHAQIGDGIELHRGMRIGSDELLFRTFGDTAIPPEGRQYLVQWWWTPGTRQMLLDAPEWRRGTVDHHWYCPLTYQSLDQGEDAYTDGLGNWISVSGWEKFVRDDRLRLGTA